MLYIKHIVNWTNSPSCKFQMGHFQYQHPLDWNFRRAGIHLSFLWHWLQLLCASFSHVSSCFVLHWKLGCIQDIWHFHGLVGASGAGGCLEKIWAFLGKTQQSTSKDLFLHLTCAFAYCASDNSLERLRIYWSVCEFTGASEGQPGFLKFWWSIWDFWERLWNVRYQKNASWKKRSLNYAPTGSGCSGWNQPICLDQGGGIESH